VFRRSRAIYDETKGAFNPAVGPLVRAWGFGPDEPETLPGDGEIRALLKLVSFEAFELRDSPPAVRKHLAGAQLDFGAIAPGYAVDAIGSLLERHGVTNYLVEIGGEVRARGKHPDGRGWKVGIEKPAEDPLAPRRLHMVFTLQDAGLATSGNYRNFQVRDGKRIGHILNPRTGYPEPNSLLSVSVLAGDAMSADAYATAFMVMGLEEALRFVEAHDRLEALFLTTDEAGNVAETRSAGFPQPLQD
jgi:thiamine biosynthesis lipoprotein